MKYIYTFFILLTQLVGTTQDGVPDVSFGTNGKRSVSLGNPVNPEMQKIIAVTGNKILHGFSISNGTNNDFGLVRYNEDGSLDGSFGTGGLVTTDFGGDDAATSMMVLSDGKILLGGYSVNTTTGNSVFALARYNADGTLDAGFGSGGRVTTAIGTDDYAYSLNLQQDGNIILAGYSRAGTAYRFAVARYLGNGSPDPSFGTGGIVTTSFSGVNDAAYSTTIQSDGKILLGGFSSNGTTSVFAAARYLPNGSLDPTFDSDGRATIAVGSNWDAAHAIAVQPNGSVVLAGYSFDGTDNEFALARLTATGAADPTFNGTGKVITSISSGSDIIYSIALQTDGRYIVSGYTFNGTDDDFIVARYLPTGMLDDQFGATNSGYTVLDFSGNDYGYSITSQSSRLLIGGTTGTSLALARLVNSSIILPVSLIHFTASKQLNTVVLNWQTGHEQNTSGFEVQRSSDGVHYTVVGTVKASGSSSSVKNYTLTDATPLPSVNFYRIRIINGDGSSSFSRSVVIRFDGKGSSLLAFPNPVRNDLNLQLTAPAGKYRAELTDVTGRMIRQMELRSSGSVLSTSIDLSLMKNGIYFIRVNNETIKVVKE